MTDNKPKINRQLVKIPNQKKKISENLNNAISLIKKAQFHLNKINSSLFEFSIDEERMTKGSMKITRGLSQLSDLKYRLDNSL